jgi:hypothetical protein
MNDLGGIESVIIKDNGQGITPDELSNRFVLVSLQAYSDPRKPHRLGRFGVGRLAIHRIGSQSEWSTVAELKDGTRVSIFESSISIILMSTAYYGMGLSYDSVLMDTQYFHSFSHRFCHYQI